MTVLAAATLAVVAVLVWLGMKAGDRYAAAKEAYDGALSAASGYEKLEPYPTRENLAAKKVALDAYRSTTSQLQDKFKPYRPAALANITVEDFAEVLKAARDETLAAFGEQTTTPEAYYMGFQPYRTALPNGNATGVLVYQMEAVKQMMLNLAKAGASRVVNIHRPLLEEERGQTFAPAADQIARALPIELTFSGTEAAVRQFLSTLVNADDRYLVVRSLSIRNGKAQPPNVSDAQFDRSIIRGSAGTPAGAPAAVIGGADLSALFDGNADAGKDAKPAAAPAPAPVEPVDGSQILSQVLGSEELVVFVRVDIMILLEPKELP